MSWKMESRLKPFDGMGGEMFGTSVSVHENRVLVGAPSASGHPSKYGAVYSYRYTVPVYQMGNPQIGSLSQWRDESKIIWDAFQADRMRGYLRGGTSREKIDRSFAFGYSVAAAKYDVLMGSSSANYQVHKVGYLPRNTLYSQDERMQLADRGLIVDEAQFQKYEKTKADFAKNVKQADAMRKKKQAELYMRMSKGEITSEEFSTEFMALNSNTQQKMYSGGDPYAELNKKLRAPGADSLEIYRKQRRKELRAAENQRQNNLPQPETDIEKRTLQFALAMVDAKLVPPFYQRVPGATKLSAVPTSSLRTTGVDADVLSYMKLRKLAEGESRLNAAGGWLSSYFSRLEAGAAALTVNDPYADYTTQQARRAAAEAKYEESREILRRTGRKGQTISGRIDAERDLLFRELEARYPTGKQMVEAFKMFWQKSQNLAERKQRFEKWRRDRLGKRYPLTAEDLEILDSTQQVEGVFTIAMEHEFYRFGLASNSNLRIDAIFSNDTSNTWLHFRLFREDGGKFVFHTETTSTGAAMFNNLNLGTYLLKVTRRSGANEAGYRMTFHPDSIN